MKKKETRLFVALLLTLVMIICFTACGGKPVSNDIKNSPSPSVKVTENINAVEESKSPDSIPTQNNISNPVIDPMNEKQDVTKITPKPSDKFIVIGSELGNKFMSDMVTSYRQKTGRGIVVNREGLNPKVGLNEVSNGHADFASITKPLSSEEKSLNLKQNIVAYEAIAIIVNNSNNVKNLTVDQVRKIFTGEIKNWSELGGSGGQIKACFQQGGDGERVYKIMNGLLNIEKISNDGKKTVTSMKKNAALFSNDNEIMEEVSQQENAIGIISFDNVDNASIYPVDINGVEPSLENVRAGKYGLSIPFIVVSKEEPKAEIKSLIDYIKGTKGQESISAKGYISVLKQ